MQIHPLKREDYFKPYIEAGTHSHLFNYTWNEFKELPNSWIDDLIVKWIKQGYKVCIYNRHFSMSQANFTGQSDAPPEISKYHGVIMTPDSWIEWINTWWSIYYVLDDGSEIYGKDGHFIKGLTEHMAVAPVIMLTADNTEKRTNEQLKTRKFPIEKRKIIGYWRSEDDFVPARFEDVSRPNPFGFCPGKNRKRKSKGTIVNFTRLIRGDFDDHGAGTLYHIRINTPTRPLYKIGLTKTSVYNRFSGNNFPYEWSLELLNSISGLYAVMAIVEQMA